MEDGQATAGLVFEPQGRDSSFALHQKMQGKELNPQQPVRMFLELLGLNLRWAQLLVCPQDASNSSPEMIVKKRGETYSMWPHRGRETNKMHPQDISTILFWNLGLNRRQEVCIAKQSWSKHGPAHH